MRKYFLQLVLVVLWSSWTSGEVAALEQPTTENQDRTEETDGADELAESNSDGELSTVEEGIESLDPVTARLLSEVRRYYRGIERQPSDRELTTGVRGASQMLLADVSLVDLSVAIDRAIEKAVDKASPGGSWLFEIVVPTYVRRPVLEEPKTDAGKTAAGTGTPKPVQKIGTGLMISAFVAQGFSLASTIATVIEPSALNEEAPGLWIIQASSIPFAPLGVTGFVLRFGGESPAQRLIWTGIGLLQAAAYSGLVGGFSIAAAFSPDMGEAGLILIPGFFGHVSASIAFAISGGICLTIGKEREAQDRMSDSSGFEQRNSSRVWVVPTVAPRPKGLLLGVSGIF